MNSTENPLFNADQKTKKQLEAERYANFEEPKDQRVLLIVKARSLQDEAKLIRRKEQGHPRGHALRMKLANHRRTVVRREARMAQLALAFLRGKYTYKQIEPKVHPGNEPDWVGVYRLIERYGHLYDPSISLDANRAIQNQLLEDFSSWRQGTLDLAKKPRKAA